VRYVPDYVPEAPRLPMRCVLCAYDAVRLVPLNAANTTTRITKLAPRLANDAPKPARCRSLKSKVQIQISAIMFVYAVKKGRINISLMEGMGKYFF